MVVFGIILFVLLIIWIIVMYDKYFPEIDIFKSRNKHIVLLWYNKWYWSGECKRTYIKLFEV